MKVDKIKNSEYKSHKNLYISKNGHIILEKNSKYFDKTVDFLVAIAEPRHRTINFHEYEITEYSLYAAASMNIPTDEILLVLRNMCKHELPENVENIIISSSKTKGKVKLILKKQRYFIKTNDLETKNFILKSEKIQEAHQKALKNNVGVINISNPMNKDFQMQDNFNENNNLQNIINKLTNSTVKESGEDLDDKLMFEIDIEFLEEVKKICIDIGYPLLEEYDYKEDNKNPNMNISTKLKCSVRPYQEKALSIMFKQKRARSGIIVLPCGAGKTLVGILATVTINKNTAILCNSASSVEQWYHEFRTWTNIDPKYLVRLTSKGNKDELWDLNRKAGVFIVTYTMIAFNGKRSTHSQEIIDKISQVEWGLLIMDEVHIFPADKFRKTANLLKAHCKLGLTATLVREDCKIKDLHYLVGPKHYEADWVELQKDGYLARVQCIEILTEMHPKYYEEYLGSSAKKKLTLFSVNPNKLLICKSLISHHKGEKIIIFCDNIFTLDFYAEELSIPKIYGEVPQKEREAFIDKFKNTNLCNCIIMSKVGDTSLDIPNASVLIQISSHGGSRRQEAQRLGRILRPKPESNSEYNAYFYSIISKNTKEMFFNNKRHEFLINQGFSFKVVDNLAELGIKDEFPLSVYEKDPTVLKCYNKIKELDENNSDFENDDDSDNDIEGFSSDEE